MTSFSASNKPFITSMLLDELQSLLFDFATSNSCAAGAPPRMKKGRIPAGRVPRQRSVGYSRCEPDHQCDPGCLTSTTVCRSPASAKHVREHLTQLGHPVTRPFLQVR